MVHSIHPRTIQEVKEKADIVDVISEHIVLKKKGKEFVGICPFHDDTKPSMTVSPSKQFYYCFSYWLDWNINNLKSKSIIKYKR